jgi:hypothetical protein
MKLKNLEICDILAHVKLSGGCFILAYTQSTQKQIVPKYQIFFDFQLLVEKKWK